VSNWTWLSKALLGFAGAISVTVIAYQIILLAGYKPFWFDEGNEVLNSCAKSYSSILINGASAQCSRAPLYYILQKLIVAHVPLYGNNIFYFFRTISIVSATLTLIILFLTFTKYLSLPWGLFALFLINKHGPFHQYGAQNRPYMLWVLLFSASLVIVSSVTHKSWSKVSVTTKVTLAFLAVALALIASGGMVQAVGFLVAIFLWQESFRLYRWIKLPSFKFLFPVSVLCCGMGMYYALQGCLEYKSAGTGDLLETKDWTLIGNVVSILWSVPGASCRDYMDPCGLVTAGLDVFVLVGMAAPFLMWKDRQNLTEDKQFVVSVGLVSLVQILCAIILGILIARAHYYFIGRMFIYLMVLQVALGVCGCYICVSWMFEKWHKRSYILAQVACGVIPGVLIIRGHYYFTGRVLTYGLVLEAVLIVVIGYVCLSKFQKWHTAFDRLNPQSLKVSFVVVLVVVFSGSLYRTNRELAIVKNKQWPVLAPATCPPMTGPLAVVSREEHAIKGQEEYLLNFIALFGEQLRTCAWVPGNGSLSYVVPKRSLDPTIYSYQITRELPVGSVILGFFHQPLLLSGEENSGRIMRRYARSSLI